jgi:hypothetical protein
VQNSGILSSEKILLLTIVADAAIASKDSVRVDRRIVGNSADVKLIAWICSNDSLRSKLQLWPKQKVWSDIQQREFRVYSKKVKKA